MAGKYTNEPDADPSEEEIAADARRRRENEYRDTVSWLRGAWAGDYPEVEFAGRHTLFNEAMLDSANEVEAYVNGIKKEYAAVIEAAKRVYAELRYGNNDVPAEIDLGEALAALEGK